MQDWHRFAIYYLPAPGPLADLAARWLGWDIEDGHPRPHPDLAGLPLPVAEITATPRKYGFHGTIKPPFRLAPGEDAGALQRAFGALCDRLAPVSLPGLALHRLGGFLALTPEGDTSALAALAARAVMDLDRFRAPPPEAELARRRARPLSPAQEANLAAWGYPYVMDEFRFHLTLTGNLAPAEASSVADILAPEIEPLLPRPFTVDTLCLVGSDAEDRFRLIERRVLGGR